MKKSAALLLLLCLLLSACGGRQTGEAPPAPEMPEPTAEPTPLPGPELPAFPPEQSQAMARLLGANRVLLLGDMLYCYDFDAEWRPALACYRLEGGELLDYRVLAAGCVPEYLCALGEELYYIDRLSGALERVPQSGGERESLHPGPCSCLSLWEGQLCFLDETGRLLMMDPVSGQSQLLWEGPCAFACPLPGAILWLASDGSGLYLSGESTVRLCAELDQAPLLLEDALWFCSGASLHSLSPAGERVYALPEYSGAVELLPTDGGLQVRGVSEQNGLVQWEGAPEGPFRALDRGYQICDWLGDGLRVDTVYEPDGRIRCYLLRDGQGRSIRFLAGEAD